MTTSQAMATRVYCTQYRATVPRHRAMTLKMSFRGNRFGMSGEYTKKRGKGLKTRPKLSQGTKLTYLE